MEKEYETVGRELTRPSRSEASRQAQDSWLLSVAQRKETQKHQCWGLTEGGFPPAPCQPLSPHPNNDNTSQRLNNNFYVPGLLKHYIFALR